MSNISRLFFTFVGVILVFTYTASAEGESDFFGQSCVQRFTHIDCGEALTCRNGTCAYCIENSDCRALGLICVDSEVGRVCKHKNLFPMDWRDILGTFAAFLGIALAVGGGIGGGGVLVPIYILVVEFSTHQAIPLSKASIFGAAVSQFYFNSRKRHPSADRPLIDYDTALILEPMTLGGTIVGVFCNKIFPNWLITLLLVVFLAVTTYRTLKKAVSIYQKEKIRDAETKQREVLDDFGVDTSRNRRWWHSTFQDDDEVSLVPSQTSQRPAPRHISMFSPLDRLLFAEKHTPIMNIIILAFVWCVVLLSQLLKGGEGAPSVVGIECGSLWYWLVVSSTVPVLIGITIWIGRRFRRKFIFKSRIKYQFQEGDVKWDHRGSILYPALCFFAGLAAGMLGIGGGMVKGPLMLEMGILPLVSTATSAFMILFTSSCTSAQFLIMGMLKWDYAIWFFVLGVVSSYVGMSVIGYLLRKYNKVSLLVFLLGLTIGMSAILMGSSGAIDVYLRAQAGRSEGFRSVCAAPHPGQISSK